MLKQASVYEHCSCKRMKLTRSLVVARYQQLGSLKHGRVMHARRTIGWWGWVRSHCSHDAAGLSRCQVCSMVRLSACPLVHRRRLREGSHWTGRCIVLRRDGCSCRCRALGSCLETRLHHRPRLRLRGHKSILVGDARVSFQQIASSKRRPTETDERFLFGVWEDRGQRFLDYPQAFRLQRYLRVRTWRSKCSVRRNPRPQWTQIRAFAPRPDVWGDGDGMGDSEYLEKGREVDLRGKSWSWGIAESASPSGDSNSSRPTVICRRR